MNPYDDAFPDMKTGEILELQVDGHAFRITATRDTAINTGRRRYVVDCTTCNESVHPGSTGPEQHIEFHLREARAHQIPPPPDDQDAVTLRDADGALILQVARLPGRAKVYVWGPGVDATSIPNETARALVELITDTLVHAGGSEIADIEARLAMLRAASRPSELHTGRGTNGNFKEPTAQGNIISAITKLERRRTELMLGKVR